MRRLSIETLCKKVRGKGRRLKALERWAESFEGFFPSQEYFRRPYCNWKIPVLQSLIKGGKAKQSAKASCAQSLILACHYLIKAKPVWAEDYRVTCLICEPNMFSSEICIYADEQYFQSHVTANEDDWTTREVILGKSLSKNWNLTLPEVFF